MRDANMTFDGRILYLTEDEKMLRTQLYDGVDLPDGQAHKLIDNISTDELTPGWVCYYYDETLARPPGCDAADTSHPAGDVRLSRYECARSRLDYYRVEGGGHTLPGAPGPCFEIAGRVVEGDERRSRRGMGTAERSPGPAGPLHARSARPAVRAARRRSERATGGRRRSARRRAHHRLRPTIRDLQACPADLPGPRPGRRARGGPPPRAPCAHTPPTRDPAAPAHPSTPRL